MACPFSRARAISGPEVQGLQNKDKQVIGQREQSGGRRRALQAQSALGCHLGVHLCLSWPSRGGLCGCCPYSRVSEASATGDQGLECPPTTGVAWGDLGASLCPRLPDHHLTGLVSCRAHTLVLLFCLLSADQGEADVRRPCSSVSNNSVQAA